jgi:hypothetical protein
MCKNWEKSQITSLYVPGKFNVSNLQNVEGSKPFTLSYFRLGQF